MKYVIENQKCVNSNYKARFLADDNEDYCQCSIGDCKIRVSVEQNGHTPYTYILTEQELENLKIKLLTPQPATINEI
jgi:hypothetical protein